MSEHLKIQDVALMGIWFHENNAVNYALEKNTWATAGEEVIGLSSEKSVSHQVQYYLVD